MIELLFLGTAATVPSAERGLPALLLRFGPHRVLVDCGEGTQRQLLQSGVGLRRLNRILLTHADLDHVLGLAGLSATLGLLGGPDRLTIHAGPATLAYVRRYLVDAVWAGRAPPQELIFEELRPGPVIADADWRLACFPVRHRASDSFGFRLDATQRRHLRADRLVALGIADGPVRARLAHGEAVLLEDGRTVTPEEVLGPPRAGVSVAVIGDCEETDSLVEHVGGVDALVIEASFLDRDAALARRRSHLTAGDSARLAAAAGVGTLYLNHISERYRPEEVLAEAQRHFPRVVLAEDFRRFVIARPSR